MVRTTLKYPRVFEVLKAPQRFSRDKSLLYNYFRENEAGTPGATEFPRALRKSATIYLLDLSVYQYYTRQACRGNLFLSRKITSQYELKVLHILV